MGEAKQEEAKADAKVEEKKDEEKKEATKAEEKKEEEKKAEDKKEEEAKPPPPPPPPPPVILGVDLHCVGCAKKIERCLLKCKGVEEVEADMGKNQVKIKGVVDPQALCARLEKKTMRSATVISPVLTPPADQPDAPPKPQVVASQVGGVTTVELHVNMHCDACAQQLRRRILKMRGVQAAETDLSSGKVTVTGTMTGDKLVDYIYRRTGKLARVIPPPPPPPPPEEKKDDVGGKKPEEGNPSEEKKEEKQPEDQKKEEDKSPPPAADQPPTEENKEEKKEEGGQGPNMQFTGPEEMVKRMMYWNNYNNHVGYGYNYNYHNNYNNNYMGGGEDEFGKQMVPWMPVHVIDRPPPPPPQMFSDENPNACCIS